MVKRYSQTEMLTRTKNAILTSGMMPSEIARKACCSRSRLYSFMSGESGIRFDTIARIAKVLDVSLDYLAYGGTR